MVSTAESAGSLESIVPVVLAGSPTSSVVLGQEAGQLLAGCAAEIQPCPRVGCGLEK